MSARSYLRADARRRQLLDAAGRVFARGGYAGLTMVSLAEEAGVSRRLVYDHFPDLAALYRAFFDDVTARYLAAADQAVAAAHGDVQQAFLGAFEHLLSMPASDRHAIDLLLERSPVPELRDLRRRFQAHVEGRWLDALSGADPSTRALARPLLWLTTAGVFQLVDLVDDGTTSADEARALARALVAHLAPIAAAAAATTPLDDHPTRHERTDA